MTKPENNHSHLGQIPNPLALAHYLATTPFFMKKAVFVVMNTFSEQEIFIKSFPFFDSQKKEIIIWENNLFNLLKITQSSAAELASNIIVSTKNTFTEKIFPDPQTMAKNLLSLNVNEKIDLQTVQEFLALNGFERGKTANFPGTWAGRGEILDLYLTQPTRLIFNENKIEKIFIFDLISGQQKRSLKKIDIPALNLKGRSAVTDYLPKDTALIDYHAEIENPLLINKILITPLISKEAFNVGYHQTKAYHLRYQELQKDGKNKTIFAFTEEPEKIKKIFSGNLTLKIIPIKIPSPGFVHQNNNILVLTDATIGLAEQKQNKKISKLRQTLLQKITTGDYVVHLHHGIARFGGMTTMHVNKKLRDYFVLEYAGQDKIYVPVEQAEVVDKYIGEAHPRLQRLAGASWIEVVHKVQEDSWQLANELLELYARRHKAVAQQIVTYQIPEEEFSANCSFSLTADQETALQEVYKDIVQQRPMDRLLCGDVGFGKTEVALRTAFKTALNGHQVALLAPTTILAQQHFDTFQERLKTFNISVELLSRACLKQKQKEVLVKIKTGKVDIVIGTHRLVSADVQFKKLGLLIIDEEQRFGVNIKERLKKTRENVHALTMTATPIPRTLNLSLSSVRDISTIFTPPEKRRAVVLNIQPLKEQNIQAAIKAELQRQGQVYYVYNRVLSINHRQQQLQKLFPQARLGVAHGQMTPQDLGQVMHNFDTGKIDILLATTIVENGLDIPNANTIIVENASNFGLAELYQLKGRVGRSDRQGYAFFFYTEKMLSGDVKKRFLALQDTQKLGAGFELAMKDMEIRGVGNMLGKEQHGHATKVGLNLYVRLLNQAVRNLEGVPEEIERDIPIDLPLEARIPEELIPDNGERIMLYQRLAIIRDREELKAKRVELTKSEQFQKDGELHPAVSGLFDVLEIKILASTSPLLAINTLYPNAHNNLHSERLTLLTEKIPSQLPKEWEPVFEKNSPVFKIRSTTKILGENWVEKLKELIQILSA